MVTRSAACHCASICSIRLQSHSSTAFALADSSSLVSIFVAARLISNYYMPTRPMSTRFFVVAPMVYCFRLEHKLDVMPRYVLSEIDAHDQDENSGR